MSYGLKIATLFCFIISFTMSGMEQPDVVSEKNKKYCSIQSIEDSSAYVKQSKTLKHMYGDTGDFANALCLTENAPITMEQINKFIDPLVSLPAEHYPTDEAKKAAVTERLNSYPLSNLIIVLHAADFLEMPLLLEVGFLVFVKELTDQLRASSNEPQKIASVENEIEKIVPLIQDSIAHQLKAELSFKKSCTLPVAKYEHCNIIRAFCLKSNGTLRIAGGWDENIKIWDKVVSEIRCEKFTGYMDSLVDQVCMSADGSTIAVLGRGFGNNRIKIWNVEDNKLDKEFSDLPCITAIGLNANGSRLIAGGNDVTVLTRNGTILCTIKVDKEFVHHVCLSPDGTRGAIVLFGDTIRIFNIQKSAQLINIPIVKKYDEISSLCMHPNNILLVLGLKDGTIELWDSATQTCIKELKDTGHPYVSQVCFSADGNTLASGNVVFCSYGVCTGIQLWDIDFVNRTLKTVTLPQAILLYALEHNLLTLSDIQTTATLKAHFVSLVDDLHNHYDPERSIKPTFFSTLKKWVPSIKTAAFGSAGVATLATALSYFNLEYAT